MTTVSTAKPATFSRLDMRTVGWASSPGLTPYPRAMEVMERRAEAIAEGRLGELVWLLEHPPLYSAGVSAKAADLLHPDRFPVFASRRGGQYTYHGPGQRVAYVMLDLRERGRDTRAFVNALETWLIGTIAHLGVTGVTRQSRVGVWVERDDVSPGREEKIAAIGVKLRHWVSFHGISLNFAPDLEHFGGIVPCGVSEHGVTSLAALGFTGSMEDVDVALLSTFRSIFGGTHRESPPDQP
jgi:lipoyl(octanoyl) transferase